MKTATPDRPSQFQPQKRPPWYFISLLAFFILPLTLLRSVWKYVDCPALLKAGLWIIGLGYLWSMVCSALGWWFFNPQTMLGIHILPNLPLEEALFYPLGGTLCILFYVGLSKPEPELTQPRQPAIILLGFMIFGTAAFIALILYSFFILGRQPFYTLSQVVLYNGLCFLLWPKVRGYLALRPVLLTTVLMTVIGFFWNWMAVAQGWWGYIATLGWTWPQGMPIDDWNFYIFATLAGISLYTRFRIPKRKGTA